MTACLVFVSTLVRPLCDKGGRTKLIIDLFSFKMLAYTRESLLHSPPVGPRYKDEALFTVRDKQIP